VSPLLLTQLDASRVLGLISFDCHPGSPFFLTSETHVVIARPCLLLPTPLNFSPQKATPILTTTLALSLLRRSLAWSVLSDVPADQSRSPPPAARALRITLNFSPQKAGGAAGRLAACVMAKGASGHRLCCPPRCLHGRDATYDPPPRGRAHIIESPRQGGN
jgi:hypothetical protein